MATHEGEDRSSQQGTGDSAAWEGTPTHGEPHPPQRREDESSSASQAFPQQPEQQPTPPADRPAPAQPGAKPEGEQPESEKPAKRQAKKRKAKAKAKPKPEGPTRGARVRLRGRFPAGTLVRLYAVSGPEQMRPSFLNEHLVGEEEVDKDGVVTFTKGVGRGDRYFICGYVDGYPLEIRATGKTKDDESGSVMQPPVQPETVRTFSTGVEFPRRGQPLPEAKNAKPVEEDD